eukprot:COSAG02_NODE_428_length_22489_cov_4.690219_8_plen_82_part_00
MCPSRLESSAQIGMTVTLRPVSDAKLLMMVLLLPRGMLDGYGGDPGGVNGSAKFSEARDWRTNKRLHNVQSRLQNSACAGS